MEAASIACVRHFAGTRYRAPGTCKDLGADKVARAEKLIERSNALFEKGKVALQNGESDAQGLITTAGNLKRAAARLVEQAELAASEATGLLVIGLVVLVALRIVEGFYANLSYEKRYLEWRGNPLVASGLNWQVAAFGGLLWLAIVPLTLYRFTVSKPWELITRFPMEKQIFTPVANEMEGWFDWLAKHGAGVFDGITRSIRAVLDGLEVVLVQTPWPVVMLVIVVTAWRLAGPRIAIFTAASLAYLAFLGLWEVSMATVATSARPAAAWYDGPLAPVESLSCAEKAESRTDDDQVDTRGNRCVAGRESRAGAGRRDGRQARGEARNRLRDS